MGPIVFISDFKKVLKMFICNIHKVGAVHVGLIHVAQVQP